MDILFASTMSNPADWLTLLRQSLPEAHILEWHDDAPPTGAELVVAWNPPESLFVRERNVRAVFNMGAGVDALLKLPGRKPETIIVRLEDAGMAVQMAEYVVYALLRASRNFACYERLQLQRKWRQQADIDRMEWPVGILGMGQMGSRVASTIAALGYPVAGWSRSARQLPYIQSFHGNGQLESFLARTRVLVNTLPLTPETCGLLNRKTLGRLLSGAYLVNVGRGEHLVDNDLVYLLNTGHILGATLDVFVQEPLPSTHPFWRDERIVITPHVAAASLPVETVRQIVEKIRQYASGKKITGIVSLEQGY